MNEATSTIYIDPLTPKKDGTCSVKIKVTFKRKRKYYPVNVFITPKQFERVTEGKRLNNSENALKDTFTYYENKANEILKQLKVFTFSAFEEAFFENRNVNHSVSYAFEKHIKELRQFDKVGTAVTYECALNSINSFNKDLTFAEVTPHFLKSYDNWMTKSGKSTTTVSMYLRCLRKIYKLQDLDNSIYPFGKEKGKYQIPTGQNIKKALTLDEVSRIYNYEAKQGTAEEMAKDYWLFLYLCNGMNVKDFCLLKWENIDGNMLYYERSKTKSTSKDSKKIQVSLKQEAKEIIKKWSQPSVSKEVYIFPHLENGMSAERQREVYQQLTKQINKYIKRIAKNVGIDKPITTYYARHSFATILKKSGTNLAMISDLLGHSSLSTTENYLDSFEDDQIHNQTEVLRQFNKIKSS